MLGDYEIRRYPGVRVRRARRWPLYGVGADATPAPATPTEAPAAQTFDAQKARDIGKALFVGTAYGIALGMILSEFVMRQKSAEAQLKQNHKLVMYGSLFGAAVGVFGATQKQAMQV